MSILWWVTTSFIIYRRSRYLYKSFKKEIFIGLKRIVIARKNSWIRKIKIFTNVKRRLIIRIETERRKRNCVVIIEVRLWKWFIRKREGIWTKNVRFTKEKPILTKKPKKRQAMKIKNLKNPLSRINFLLKPNIQINF